MSTLAIHNGRVIDPALGLDGIADIVIVDGRITRVGPNEGDMVIEANRIDATGLIEELRFLNTYGAPTTDAQGNRGYRFRRGEGARVTRVAL